MCDLCEEELDGLLDSLHERHSEVAERFEMLKALRTRLNEAFLQAKEDASEATAGEEDDEIEGEDLFDEDDEEE